MGQMKPPMDTAQMAKAALRRLALDKLEPTPENYARAFAQEQGSAPPSAIAERGQRLVERLAGRLFEAPIAGEICTALGEGAWDRAERAFESAQAQGESLSTLIERVVRNVERGGKQWTSARKKDSLQRVLEGSRSDPVRLQQRLRQLVGNWEADTLGEPESAEQAVADPALADAASPAPAASTASAASAAGVLAAPLSGDPQAPSGLGLNAEADEAPIVSALADLEPAVASNADAPSQAPVSNLDRSESLRAHGRVSDAFGQTVVRALPLREATGVELSQAITDASRRLREEGGSEPLAVEIEALCERADWVLEHRQHLFDQVSSLCLELTASLAGLAEDDSWAQGQCEAMRITVEEGLTARGVKSVSELLRTTRERQNELRVERDGARQALKHLINQMLSELGELGSQTGRFHESVGRYADVIERADTLESLAGVVREMVEESRTVQGLVEQTQSRLKDEHRRASEMSERVTQLEAELRRLSDEVSTDQLTQIANRRGLLQAFDTECARLQRVAADGNSGTATAGLAIGLLDIDNFKRLNDDLGHSAGDEALKALAATVSRTLRPTDMVARYGGEEFVVLLPDTPVDEGQQILTRLQRSLTGGLFMHENRQVFVTFSAGVTAYRPGERIEDALERADVALYQAKRAGKNRTLIS